ncbi:MAG: alpha/beta hydrolase, partial [Bacteroidetes bacterium]|nr:alpha/beta hydrolase [Bacteroidota bacterium]
KKGLGQLKRYNFEVIGNEVVEVLNHIGIVKSHFVGISLGTIIIRDLAERYPERVSAMVMAGAVMKLNLRGQVLMRLGVIFKSILPYLLLYRFFAFIIMPRKAHRNSRLLFINEAKKLYQNEFIKWFKLAAEVNPLLSFFRFKDSGISTLYIMGEEDHMFLPSIKKLVQNHKSAQLQVVANSGHVVNVDQPLEFNKRVVAYLAGIEY